MKRIFTVLIIIAFCVTGAYAKKDKKGDRQLVDKVAQWQIENHHTFKHHDLDWTNGALYRGMLEWADYTSDQRYYDFLLDVGNRNDWGYLKRVYHADDLCVGQMYIGMYNKYGRPEMIESTLERVDYIIDNPSDVPLWHGVKGGSDRWSWCDALFMAPPVFTGLYNLTGDNKYLVFMDREFKLTTDSLYSADDGLYYRDRTFIGRQEKNGEKVFWGRGNGWVFGGLAILLNELPKSHPTYGYYKDLFVQMADAIVRCQQESGSWHASMYDPQSYPIAENSGSSFFVYGLSWGVNNKILKDRKYKNAAVRGWEALKTYVNEDGKLTSVQPIGAAPGTVTPEMTEVYGVGAFLLAGVQMQQMRY